jgi:hypothetical protein
MGRARFGLNNADSITIMMHQYPAGSRARVVTGAPRYRTLAEQAVVRGAQSVSLLHEKILNVMLTSHI